MLAHSNEWTGSSESSFTVGEAQDCDLTVAHSGWGAGTLNFEWDAKTCCWRVSNQTDVPLYVDYSLVAARSSRLLRLWRSILRCENVLLLYQRTPAPPTLQGRPVVDVSLEGGLLIGRGPPRDDEGIRKLELDPDLTHPNKGRRISSRQAKLEWRGKDLYLLNLNTNSQMRSKLNGIQQFDELRLGLGDCIQIPTCPYYTFKFTGQHLHHVGGGGSLQGKDLCVDVDSGRILHEVSLDLLKGEFLGVIGGSGQGKSTLLNALCGIGSVSQGAVYVEGGLLESSRDVARANIGYVPQDDIVHKELRVIDALTYAARLRVKATAAQRKDLIHKVLEELALAEHAAKKIHQLSGGQRKRVSIATELLASPDYLFLDEPTSGLDPQTERDLMGTLQKLTRNRGIGAACTTHVLQSSNLLDRLAYISRGRLIYHGSPENASRFFLDLGDPGGADASVSGMSVAGGSLGSYGHHGSSFPSHTTGDSLGDSGAGSTSRDYLLQKIPLIYGKALKPDVEAAEQDIEAKKWEDEFKQSAFFQPADPLPTDVSTRPPTWKQQRRPGAGFLVSLGVLLARQWSILVSAPLNYLFLILQAVAIGLMVGWVDDSPVLQMFLCVIATLWFGCSNGAQQIVAELAVFRRERLAGLGLNAYLIAKFGFWTFITTVQAILLFAIVLASSHLFHPDRLPGGNESDADIMVLASGEVAPHGMQIETAEGQLVPEDRFDVWCREQGLDPTKERAQARRKFDAFVQWCRDHDLDPDKELAQVQKRLRLNYAQRNFAQRFFDAQDVTWRTFVEKAYRSPDGATTAAAEPTAPAKEEASDSEFESFTIIGLDAEPESESQGSAASAPSGSVEDRRAASSIFSPTTAPFNPTGLSFASGEYRVLEWLTWLFRARPNVEGALGVRLIPQDDLKQRELLGIGSGSVSWRIFIGELIGLRLLALVLASAVGVGLGLAISAMVQTPTQAVMWVPLILIPQILFGAFVVTAPNMADAVYAVSRVLPSFNLQRIMDVSLVHGRHMTDMSDDSKVPSFKARAPYDSDEVRFDRQVTHYNRVSEVNESWQNLVVDREKLGQRALVEGKDSVSERPDVLLKGARSGEGNSPPLAADVYLDTTPAYLSAQFLMGWFGGCYLVALGTLWRRQNGR
ncbi:MAG: ATP-binding cassette domain-containing protein [Verrucomicrobiales bacterium]|nr:ATP-binding cassette domain-containing protein [Verrucomicrobiales bacterium]